MSQTHAAARVAGQTRAERVVRLRWSSLGVVVMLIIQFIVGIVYNLYGTAPTSTKSVGLFSSPVIALHVVLGILLGLAAIGQLVRAIPIRHKLSIWMSALGLLSIIGAGFAGLGFAGSGASSASLGMSLAFAAALACYIVLLVALPSSAVSETSSTT
jgi:hypothetical protein